MLRTALGLPSACSQRTPARATTLLLPVSSLAQSHKFMFKPSNGLGSYTWSDGKKYTGEWKERKPHGRGEKEGPNGSIYEGNFSNGNQQGTGVHRWADGSIFDGGWKMT